VATLFFDTIVKTMNKSFEEQTRKYLETNYFERNKLLLPGMK